MRILFASHYALPHIGGIETAIHELATELSARGHDVTHLASDAASPAAAVPPDPERAYRAVRLPAWNALERRAGVPVPLPGPRLLRALREEASRAEVVHAHGFLYPSSAVALGLAGRRRPAPARVLTEHVGHVHYENAAIDAVERAGIASVGRAVTRMAEAVVVISDKVAAEIRALAPGARIERIENGVNLERYRPPEPGERERIRGELGWNDDPRALFVGRLVAKKGLALAIEAARAAGVGLAVAGPGRLDGPAPEGVEVLGALPPARVAQLYRAADAFLLPSRGEGFPVTVQEALASGLPVVVADDPSYEPYLRGAGAAARLAEPRGPALAQALSELVASATAREAAALAAVEHARRSYSWTRAADQHESLYAQLSAARG